MDQPISRRNFIKTGAIALASISMTGHGVFANAAQGAPVYLTKDISSAGVMKVYGRLMENRALPGKVALKLHSGEPGGHNYPAPALIKELIHHVDGTIVECNTAYRGKRFKTADHMKALEDHGFTGIAAVDVMDENGSISLPYPKGKWIKENFVGEHFANYDSFLILSHFKGHAMGGFGGAIKNTSIGIASGEGKMWIHTAGGTKKLDSFGPAMSADQDKFLESMAEATGSVIDKLGNDKIVYINLMNNLSIDCDCDSNPAPPELDDIGILASLDPVALDHACVDLVYAADKGKSASLRERIESRHGTHTLDHAEAIGIGRQEYTLIGIDA